MRIGVAIAVALLAIAMAGCALRGKAQPVIPAVPTPVAAVPAPPPEPLSAPQTHVQLPPPQPFNPDALVVEAPPTPQPVAQTTTPAPTPRRNPAVTPVVPKPADPPPPTVVADPPRPLIQEQLPADRKNEYLEKANASRKAVREWLDSSQAQHLTGQAKLTRDQIVAFLHRSDQAEQRGNFLEARQLADRAATLMKEFQGGR